MAVALSIKDVPDELAQALKARAARNHRSIQGELMYILERAVSEDDRPFDLKGLLKERDRLKVPRTPSESTAIIRAMRDSRYADRRG